MARLLLFHLWLAVVASPMAAFAGEVKLGDDIATGIQTSAEFDVRPFGYRVTWINWDSYFRESELRLGDRILGVNGERYTREAHNLGYAIGNHGENRYWADRGAKDGDPVTLIVERDGEEITVSGRLMANRFYFSDDGRQTLGLGGPDRLLPEVDENGSRVFDSSWGGWYQDKTEPKPGSWQFLLDGSWERTGFNNRMELEAHLEDKERIDYLVEKYPSEFAETMRRDWEHVRDYLDGEAVELRGGRARLPHPRGRAAQGDPGLCRARDRRARGRARRPARDLAFGERPGRAARSLRRQGRVLRRPRQS